MREADTLQFVIVGPLTMISGVIYTQLNFVRVRGPFPMICGVIQTHINFFRVGAVSNDQRGNDCKVMREA